MQIGMTVIKQDFTQTDKAAAGFQVLAGDEIHVFIADDLVADLDLQPIMLYQDADLPVN